MMRFFDWLFGRRPGGVLARTSRADPQKQEDDDDAPRRLRPPPVAEARWVTKRPVGDWRILAPFEVRGIERHHAAAKRFILAAKSSGGAGCAAELRREPHDANAVAIWLAASGCSGKVGYASRDIAALIAQCPPDMPLGAMVSYFRLTETDFIVIELLALIPAKRAAFWRDHRYPF